MSSSDTAPELASVSLSIAPLADVPLDWLPLHCCAVIRRIEVAADDMDRLKTMGLCVGRRVEVVKVGDPMIVRVMETRIGLGARSRHHRHRHRHEPVVHRASETPCQRTRRR